jgi:hypothetical protein
MMEATSSFERRSALSGARRARLAYLVLARGAREAMPRDP